MEKICTDKNVFIRDKRIALIACCDTFALLPASGEHVRADVNATEM